MDILFSSNKLRTKCSNKRERQKYWGTRREKVIGRRLDDLRAAQCLADMRLLPGRCHELTGERKGQLALDLDGPYRLIFEVADAPTVYKEDGGLAWEHVTAVRILEVEDYHGR